MERLGLSGRLVGFTLACLLVLDLTVATQAPPSQAITVVMVGDVMLGRGVAPIAEGEPEGLFREVRHLVRRADLALANLESPLTNRPHVSGNPHALEADPATADLLANAGFDVFSLANNHAGDAGSGGILDSIAAVRSAGMDVVGAGADDLEARGPLLTEVGDTQVAVLAFDAGSDRHHRGVATWDPVAAEQAVRQARVVADLVIVSVHGGVQYLPESDPRMVAVADQLVAWGADVVWGHGPHVVQPVAVQEGAVVATSLGNFLFDQRGPLTGRGAILEVMADGSGVVAYRIGDTSHGDLRVHFEGWQLPAGDAVLLDGAWWDLVAAVPLKAPEPTTVDHFPWGRVISASTGDIMENAGLETVVSFRHVPQAHPVRDGLPDLEWLDAAGMSAHLGIYTADELDPLWVAGMVPAPIARVAACHGSMALAYSRLDDPTVVATGAAVWRPFALDATERLPGSGVPACADVNGDGGTEPVVLHRRQDGP